MIGTKWNRWALAALAGLAAAATTHTVVKGDTMWDITGHYLGNPFQWPMVWKYNPQIKNAHWIYPGDTVHLEGGSQKLADTASPELAARPSSDPLASFQSSPSLYQQPGDTSSVSDLVVPPNHNYLNEEVIFLAPVLVPPGQFGKAAFEGHFEWDAGAGYQQIFPGNLIQVNLGSNKVKLGDRLMAIESGDQVSRLIVHGMRGRLEQARAVMVVAEVRTKSCLVRIQNVFGAVTRTVVVRPFELTQPPMVTDFLLVNEETAGKVMANTATGRSQLPGSYVFVDRGEAQGVALGDIMEFMDVTVPRGMAAMRGYGMVVRVTPTTSTVLLVGTNPKPILPGDRAWRIRRAARG
ncbi:MAG: LysM peptidoglycan-binding domain-containing protein [Fibrobacterota bacterium]|nr:MAG: LysM peptidoglycan-binding domain-containing protein [Fibrobacterota bacterium]